MDLLERYLQAVKALLPASERDDIIRELSEDIMSEMDDREAELGRPLTDAEESEILKRRGHPIVVAFRFRPRRYLIGPSMFPLYWLTVRIGLAIVSLGYVAAAVVMLALGKPVSEAVNQIAGFLHAALPMLGWITIVYATMDWIVAKFHLLDRWMGSWNPASLPAVRKQELRVPRSESISQIVFGSVFGAWALAWLSNPHLPVVIGSAASVIKFTAVWHAIRIPAVLLVLAGPVQGCVNLFRPEWLRFRLWVDMAASVVGLVTVGLLLNAGQLVTAAGAADEVSRYLATTHIVNTTLIWCVVVSGIVYQFKFSIDLWKTLTKKL